MTDDRTGDELLRMLNALANPHRLRILAALSERQSYVSELARELGIGRPLLHMHLQTLERAGLVVGRHEISEDGKALRFYEVTGFDEHLTPERVTEATKTLSPPARVPCAVGDGRRRPTDGPSASGPSA